MSDCPHEKPVGPILDELGVTVHLADNQRVTEALVILKVVDLDTGETHLCVEANDIDWITQWGLHAAAGQAFMSVPPRHTGDDDG